MRRFFVGCPLKFESSLVREITEFWHKMIDLDGLPTRSSIPEFETVQGGVEFGCEMHLGLQINFFTKIGLRVLLRLEKFEARYFDQFEKHLKKIDFQKIFPANQVAVEISSQKSRLFHERNLLEAAQKVLMSQGLKFSNEAPQAIYIRIHKDEVEISLDSSGEHLHRRGYRKYQSQAPIRENLASLMIQLSRFNEFSEGVVIDPFCGSGTLLFEAAALSKGNFKRNYSFLDWKNCPALFKSSSFAKNYFWLQQKSKLKFIGFDIDSQSIEKAKMNKIEFEKLFNCEINVNFFHSDCKDFTGLGFENVNQISIFANPPYGERLPDKNVTASFQKMIDHLVSRNRLLRVAILQTHQAKPMTFGLDTAQSIPFSNQGIQLDLLILEKKPIVT